MYYMFVCALARVGVRVWHCDDGIVCRLNAYIPVGVLQK